MVDDCPSLSCATGSMGLVAFPVPEYNLGKMEWYGRKSVGLTKAGTCAAQWARCVEGK